MFEQKPNWWEMMKVKLSTGRPFTPTVNLGILKAHNVIRYKDWYISVMELENGELNIGWSDNPHAFPDVNINDFWTSTPGDK